MKNIFQALKKYEPVKSEAVKPFNMAVVVESYDVKATPPVLIGTNLETGEKVSLYLREDTTWDALKGERVPAERHPEKQRKGIADFANRRDLSHVTAGGVILAEAVFADRKTPGLFSAQWMNQVQADPDPKDAQDRREVFLVQARAHPPVTKGEKSYIRVDMLRTDASRAVTTEKEVEEALVAAFETNGERSPFAVLRLYYDGPDGVEAKALAFSAKYRKEEVDGVMKTIYSSGADSAEETLKKDFFVQPDGIKGFLGQPNFTVEVIPGETVFLGGKSAENAVKHNRQPDKAFRLPVPEGAPDGTLGELGFNKSVVAIARYNGDEAGAGFVTSIFPLRRLDLTKVDYVATPIANPGAKLDPKPTQAAAPVAPASKGGSVSDAVEQELGAAVGAPAASGPAADEAEHSVERASRRTRAVAR